MKVYIAIAYDYEESSILGVFADETTAYVEGNARRSERERDLPVGTIWQPITFEHSGHTYTSDYVFDLACMRVTEHELES